jgi:leukotriene-A4 hydrolase
MGKTYGFESSQNIEVVSRYFRIGLAARDETVYAPTAQLLGKVGRMKFVRPYVVFDYWCSPTEFC